MSFDDWFRSLSGNWVPHPWQAALATEPACRNRTVRIPTGFGKTLGVLAVWLWHRIHRDDDHWPRRLVWCLPMRVLVEQTAAEIRAALIRLGILWEGDGCHDGRVGVHVLMGGNDAGTWQQFPAHCAVLIGTQDMLLSRALNRGYASPRARWPMDFGLLNQDCLWIMDEVQLMDVGLATSAQLQAFRDDDAGSGRGFRPCRTWWMSATMQTDWLRRSPDTLALADALATTSIPPTGRSGPLWDAVDKSCEVIRSKSTKALAAEIRDCHLAGGRGAAGPTLVVLNTVDRAVEVWELLKKEKSLSGTDCRLIHSRFRAAERVTWTADFLNRRACVPGTDRIIVSTQVVEAGVDISAAFLVTELAPWASLVQRFGRCARWGGAGHVLVVEFEGLKSWRPYETEAIEAARRGLASLSTPTGAGQVSPLALAAFEEANPDQLQALYPFEPTHLLLRHELDELFDTTPDLSGADVDVSRFIRSGDERDLHLFWIDLPPAQRVPPDTIRPSREALCAVPFLQARTWLFKSNSEALLPGKRAWVWDYQDATWRRAQPRDLYPGQTVLVSADSGGYDPARGFVPKLTAPVPTVPPVAQTPADLADAAQDDESLSAFPWKTIATHGRESGTRARDLAAVLVPELGELFDLAGRWHDAGKVHPAFQGSIIAEVPAFGRHDLAKAPKSAWRPRTDLYRMPDGSHRPGLRHELASTLMLFAVLLRHAPDHDALRGPWAEWLDAAGLWGTSPPRAIPPAAAPGDLEAEILALDGPGFDLLAYLVCAHHGKVRMAWHASKADQAAGDPVLRLRGVRQGDPLPSVTLATADGSWAELPPIWLDLSPAAAGLSPLTGAAWTDRVLNLLDRYGPFGLAWLEALLRAADHWASQLDTPDPLLTRSLEAQNAQPGLETDGTGVAAPAAGGTRADRTAPDPPQGRDEHGLRGRAGGREDAGKGVGAPAGSTRSVQTRRGILSYAELAPFLAVAVAGVEADIWRRVYATTALDEDFIQMLHRRVCGDLTPDIAGAWRRAEVTVGTHAPPRYIEVPLRMRDDCLDLNARLDALGGARDDAVPQVLAFAEGRLLSIHPFIDFNARVARLLLSALLHRLGLPAANPTPSAAGRAAYLAALRAADHHDWQPLTD